MPKPPFASALLLVVLSLVPAAVARGQQAPEVPDWLGITQNLRYDEHETNVLDVMVPKAEIRGRRPGVVVFHGGGWRGGTKESAWTNLCFRYAEQGFVVASVKYRLTGQATAPAAVVDALSATRWFIEHADQYNVDKERIVVTGPSAGGHLALMVGMATAAADLGEPVKVAAIVNCFGPTDVADLLEGPNQQVWAAQWVPEQDGRMELARRVSPMTYVRAGLPPVFTAQGENDPLVPLAQGKRLTEALQAAGVTADMFVMEGAGHGFTAQTWPIVNGHIFEFLTKQGILPAEQSER